METLNEVRVIAINMPNRSFLDLPREIRDQIYMSALISPTGYVIPYGSGLRVEVLIPFTPPDIIIDRCTALPLLRTCNKICSEAKDVVYQHKNVSYMMF